MQVPPSHPQPSPFSATPLNGFGLLLACEAMASGTPTGMTGYAASPPTEMGDRRSFSNPIARPDDSPDESRANSLGPDSVDLQDSNGATTAGRKRKLNSTSARGVANLTPDQLAKKRANDRQAQRAIRERTKGHIEALEQQVRDLSSQKPFLDLQAALQHNERIRVENRELRQGLRAAMDIIQPLLARPEISGKLRLSKSYSGRI